ncbi:MAG: epimerase, partial [Chthoniobacterales bacterium]
ARNASHSDAGGPNETRRVVADPLAMNSYTESIRGCDTFVHLIGVPHPSPAKARQFREIDLVSAKVAVPSATAAGIKHFIYLSVAQPASLMKDFIAVRAQGEEMIRRSGMSATFLRPWYVLGPGHRWPYFLLPIYALLGCFPATRESARRLGLVTIKQMISALVWSVENPATGIRIVDVPQIRATCRLE